MIEYDELDSTSNEAKRLVREGNAAELYGTVIVAHHQTAGRGRMGKSFASPKGDSVYSTFILPPPDNPAEQLTTALAAVAVCEAIENTTSYNPGIKWVNDVFVDGKKVCGILAESIQDVSANQGAVVLGIGVNINLNEDDLPDDLRNIAGSLIMNEVEKEAFFKALVEKIFSYVSSQEKDMAFVDAYRKRSILIGKNIIVKQGEKNRPAVALGIADDGALIVEYEDGSSDELRTGEVGILLSDS